MNTIFQFVQAHWVQILAALTSTWTAINYAFNKIANALPAPTKDDGPGYVRWFKFVNNMAGNTERAKNTAIENSPNFIPAAEAYMKQKLAEQQLTAKS